ncbi:MAG: M23 family metallopeptidase [Verrucomicrobiaceae bacterium]|nr:M23 family metallopeptidase [Verrucomicrobiaceae bacterium]
MAFLRAFAIFFSLLLVAAAAGFWWWRVNDERWIGMVPSDPAFRRLTPEEVITLPLATRFDIPLGSQHGALTYNARPFRISRHLGDDLNGIGGENSDLGDPVFAAGAGRVVYTGSPGSGWGKMILVAHRLPAGDEAGPVVQTMYAHLERVLVRQGQIVQRGEKIGTVGTAEGAYLAHLHFEVRLGAYINPAEGYADTPLNRVSPDRFIAERRGADATDLGPAPVLK